MLELSHHSSSLAAGRCGRASSAIMFHEGSLGLLGRAAGQCMVPGNGLGTSYQGLQGVGLSREQAFD